METLIGGARKYAKPANVNYSTDQYAKSVTLTWKMADPKNYDKDNAAYAGKWYVYRREQGKTAWTMLRAVTINRGDETFKYEDKDTELKLSTPYEYRVCFYPNYRLKDYARGGNIVPTEDSPMDGEQTLVANSEVRVGESRAIDLSNQKLAGADTLHSETGKTDKVRL